MFIEKHGRVYRFACIYCGCVYRMTLNERYPDDIGNSSDKKRIDGACPDCGGKNIGELITDWDMPFECMEEQ